MTDAVAPIIAAVIASLIAVISLLPKNAKLMELITPRMHRVGHFASYVLLAFLCARILAPATPVVRSAIAFLFATAFGAFMEFLQRYRPGRTPSRVDALVNATGAALGAIAAFAWSVYFGS